MKNTTPQNPQSENRKSEKAKTGLARYVSRFPAIAKPIAGSRFDFGRFSLFVLCVLCASVAKSQTNTNPPPTISGGLTQIYDALTTSGLATATNYAVEPYLTYAPNAPRGNRIGGGALIVYNVNQFVGAGLGVDYLGEFSLVSANITLKLPTHPFAFTGISWATNIAVAPFALAGVGKPLSGTTAGFSAITDVGLYASFGHLWGGEFNVGTCYGRWDNAGNYSGPREHFFLGWSKGF